VSDPLGTLAILVKVVRGRSDARLVNPRPDVPFVPDRLAEVIPLISRSSGQAQPVGNAAASRDLDVAQMRQAMEHDIELLRRRYGDRWFDLPTGLGRTAATAERLLVSGPTSLDPLTDAPMPVATGAQRLVPCALKMADRVVEEAEVLGEALGAPIADLPLRQLDDIVGAVLGLSTMTAIEPAWGAPAAADAADVVLDAFGSELRATAEGHNDLYAAFTEHVLDIPRTRLQAVDRPWRVISKARLRRELAWASRTGRVPGRLRAVAHRVLAVRDARGRLEELEPLLSSHLGRGTWGPVTDTDAVIASLAAVRRFQRALGDRLDPARFTGLLAAGAFRSIELTLPATNVQTALRRWRREVASACAGDPWAVPAPELATWALQVAGALSALTTGATAMAEIDRAPTTVRVLVDDLLLRENVAELHGWIHAGEPVALAPTAGPS
jgi:hypothetical protein